MLKAFKIINLFYIRFKNLDMIVHIDSFNPTVFRYNWVLFRKNHSRAMESMQASLEAEQRAKAESLRIKKKLEGEINELEIALDHANKANSEAQKSIKRYQVKI